MIIPVIVTIVYHSRPYAQPLHSPPTKNGSPPHATRSSTVFDAVHLLLHNIADKQRAKH
jgi:hypothetical protein